MKVLMISPRFGGGMVGGAENLIRGLGLRAGGAGVDVEVATTCATDNRDWFNVLPAGVSMEDGLLVRRFAVSHRDAQRHRFLHQQLMRTGHLSALDEADLMATSVWSRDLQRFLDAEGPAYDALVFAPYLFGTTFWGLQAWPERSIVIPCLHDEPYAHLRSMRAVLRSAAMRMYNAPGEQALGRRLLGDLPSCVVGLGFDHLSAPQADVRADPSITAPYFVYAGRLEEGKRVHIAARYVAEFARRRDASVQLIVMGRGPWTPAADVAPFVKHVGFLSEEDKRAMMAGAIALINPSELESLSIVLLEAWQLGTPALVARSSEVMTDHCRRSGGGFTFRGLSDFLDKAEKLAADPSLRASMGAAGQRYVEAEYSWDGVMRRFVAGLERTASMSAVRTDE